MQRSTSSAARRVDARRRRPAAARAWRPRPRLKRSVDARARGRRRSARAAATAVVGTRRCVNTDGGASRVDAPPAPRHVVERARATALGEPQRTSRGCPPGPGSPDGAKPSTDAPSAARTPRRRDRLAAQRRVAHHAALADALAPDLELRLDHRQAVEPRRGARRARPGRTFAQRDERDVDDDQVGRVRELRRRRRRARWRARSRSRARPCAAASRARRRRRRAR